MKDQFSDQALLYHYTLGFNDCLDDNVEKIITDPILLRAYGLGWSDGIIGDDVMSSDYQTEEEILKRIKTKQ